jgi:hypothetical protein
MMTAAPVYAQSAAPTAEDIARLQAQIQAMQEQLNELKAAQATQAQQVAKVAEQTTPPLKPEAPGWFANTSISGKAFLNVSSINQSHIDLAGNHTDDVQEGTQAELKRFYIGIDHKFNDMFSANLTTDFRYNANGTSRDVLVYVKKAYLQAKFAPELWLRVGAADLPWVPFDEGIYGYRFVENTLIDRTKFGTSSDWGVHVGGTFGKNLVSYQLSAINGAGYKTLARSTNTIDLEGRVNVNPVKNVTLAVGGYSGKLGKSNETLNVNHHATRWNALAAYTDNRIRAGVEYFWAKNWNNITTAVEPTPAPNTPDDKSNGWSAFGSFAFTPDIAVFGRYDWLKPSKDFSPGLKDNYFNVGLNYKPIKNIDLALVYKHDRVKNGFLSTSNGTIGGLDHGNYDEVGVFSQLVF